MGVPCVRNVQEVPKQVPLQSTLPMGWALRSSQNRRTRFNEKQKDNLSTKFNIGDTTGRKAGPVVVAKEMIHAIGNDGDRLFSSDEFLTSQQISSFFSRLATQKSLFDKDDTEENDDEATEFESSLEDLTNQVRREVSLQHPIVFDAYQKNHIKLSPLVVCREVDSRLTILDVFPGLYLRAHVPFRTLSRTSLEH